MYDSTFIEDIGFTLPESKVSDTVPFTGRSVTGICLLLYAIPGFVVLVITMLTSSWVRVLTKSHHASFLLATVIFGGILTIFEGLIRFIVSLKTVVLMHQYFVWMSTAIAYGVFFSVYAGLYSIKNKKRTRTKFVTLHIITYAILVYHHTLPTFLLMLAYPTMTITIFACLITFTFVSIIFCSIWLSILKKLHILLKPKRSCVRLSTKI